MHTNLETVCYIEHESDEAWGSTLRESVGKKGNKVTSRVGLNSLDALHRSLSWKSKAFAVANIVRIGLRFPQKR
jgi:hypothetical protein